jgi:hypothetical protein
MKNSNALVLSGSDTASHNGVQIDASQVYSASFHAVFGDSTAVGTVKVQASNDICYDGYSPGAFTVVNWVDVPNASASVSSGAPALITIPNVSYRWMRVVFTYSSGGSSTITVNMMVLCL